VTQSSQVLSRAAQVAEILRDEIRRGTHGEFLPGEVALASRLQVSRPTLRTALEILRRESFLRTIKGQRTRVLHNDRQTNTGQSKTIAVLTAVPQHLLNSFSLFLLGRLQTAARHAGFKLEIHSDPRLEFSCPRRSIERVIAQVNAACWIHLITRDSVLKLFRDRKVPSLVVGGMRKADGFPFVDIDRHAMCQHAVHTLRSRGLARIAVIVPRDFAPGTDERLELWRDAFKQSEPEPDIRVRVFELDYHEWGVQRTLDRVFEAFSRPVGFLVVRPKHVLAILSHLMHTGMRLPQDASVISMGYESFLDFVAPSVAYYRSNWDQFANRLCRMAVQLAIEGVLPPRPVFLRCAFHDGASLARPR